MAITYAAQLFASESTSKTLTHALTTTLKAGSLICLAFAGKRSGAYLNPSSISDTGHNTWEWENVSSEFRACGVAWTRIGRAMTSSDSITFSWNGTPSYAWKSAHAFEGASASETEKGHTFSTGTSASFVLDVTGSDWLTFAVVMLPNTFSQTLTPLNSSTSRDDNDNTVSAPWAECFSRNGSGAGTSTVGASFATSQQYAIAAVSFPFLAMPASPVGRSYGMVGI